MSISDMTKKHIDLLYKSYDKETGLIFTDSVPNYHSKLKPGMLRQFYTSTIFAAAVFASGYEKYYPEANASLRSVIAHQCKSGEFTGIWANFYEEPLDKMVAPDRNQADFHAVPMVTILFEHKDKLESDVYDLLKEALLNACTAIKNRHLTIIYTNPIVMSIYVILGCGELFDRPELTEYGLKKLRRFYFHVMSNGTYDEYNCPQYSLLIANIYSLILRNIKNASVTEKVKELNTLVWTMLGEHFHYETGEISAPSFRQYENFLREGDKAVFQHAIGDELALTASPQYSLLDIMYDTKCPDEVKPLFLQKGKFVDTIKQLSIGITYPWLRCAFVDTQYICPEFTLGSYNIMDGWNQRHAVASFMGTRERKCCIRLRALHNDYDYCSALFSTAQIKSSAVTVTNFQTNRGDTHNDLDPVIDATIKATDLRIRYEIEANTEGIIDTITVNKKENACTLSILGNTVRIDFPYSVMSGESPYFEITKEEKRLLVDLVLYHGEEKSINFNNIDKVVVVSHISIGESSVDNLKITKDGRYIFTEFECDGNTAQIRCLDKPEEHIPTVFASETKLNGENLISIAEKNTFM